MANSIIQFTEDLRSKFNGFRNICFGALIVGGVSVLASLGYGAYITAKTRYQLENQPVYIINEASVLAANRVSNESQRNLEAVDHLRNFHELMFSVAPTVTAINNNVEKALELADNSAYDFFCSQKEASFYTKMIKSGAVQFVDSVNVDLHMETHPYQAECKVYYSVMRDKKMSRYYVVTTCCLQDIARSETNPHGFLITDFLTDEVVQLKNQ